LLSAKFALADTAAWAPIDGIVANRKVPVGEYVAPGRLGVIERGLGSEVLPGKNRCAHQRDVGILRLRLRRTHM
jgi:multidrug efflux pump subunit AcrA (membrane-fusion protein)